MRYHWNFSTSHIFDNNYYANYTEELIKPKEYIRYINIPNVVPPKPTFNVE